MIRTIDDKDYTHDGVNYIQHGMVLYAKAVRGENLGNFHPLLIEKYDELKIEYSDIVFGKSEVRNYEKLYHPPVVFGGL